MADSIRTTRVRGVIGALILSGVLIGCAYLASGPLPAFFVPKTANAESTQALLAAYATKDSDNDGLPDWEEALYGTDPNNPHSVSPTLTDGEAVAQGLIKPKFSSATATSTPSAPGTDTADMPGPTAASGSITDQFSQNLFSQYLSQSDGTEPTDDQIDSYVQDAVQQLAASNEAQDAYTSADVKVGAAGADALEQYAADVETALSPYAISTSENELDYFSDAVEKNDTDELTQVTAIGMVYTHMAPVFMGVTVPPEAATAQLEIANAMARLGTDITDMGTMETDPLRAYLGLYQYQTDANALAKGFSDMNTVFATDNVSISSGPGSEWYETVAKVAQEAASETTSSSQ